MVQKHHLLVGITKSLPRARAYIAKAMTLMVAAAALPAYGYSSDFVQASPPSHNVGRTTIENAQPIAVTDYVNLKDAAKAFNVLANDSDPNQDTLTLIEASAQHGAVAFTADGLLAYATDPARPRTDEIKYVLSDGRGGRATGKVIVSIP